MFDKVYLVTGYTRFKYAYGDREDIYGIFTSSGIAAQIRSDLEEREKERIKELLEGGFINEWDESFTVTEIPINEILN